MSNPGRATAGGSSKIELDNRLLNSLLAMFVNKAGGLSIEFAEQGQIQVQQGEMNATVNPINLQQALRVQLRNGGMTPFTVQVNQIQTGPQGLTVSLNLQS